MMLTDLNLLFHKFDELFTVELFKASRTICLKAQWYVAGPTQLSRTMNVFSGTAKRASPIKTPLCFEWDMFP
ncbi:UNVERIFIED_CONTAM: hypothetical protein NCL1_27469 [Trichonephila clavipes]